MKKQCKSCKSEIDSSASKCSHCGTDQRNWFIKHKIITGIIVITVVFGVIGAAGSSNKSGTSVPAAPDNTNVGAKNNAAQVQATSAPIKAPQTLLDLTGSGSKSTQKFTTSGDWDLNWTYDCSSFGDKGNFQVFIYTGDGTMSFQNTGVNQLGSKDSGTEHYHTGGTYYLQVNSECSWTMKVQG